MPQTVFVTGSSRGIGLEFVRQCLEAGDTVIATCRKPSGNAALEELTAKHGESILACALDVTDEKSIADAVSFVKAKGIDKIDLLMNNAGLLTSGHREPGVFDNSFNTTPELMTQSFAVNTIGPMMVTQALYPLLKAAGPGTKVVHISSIVASNEDNPGMVLMPYCTSKAALNMVATMQSFDFKDDGVTVLSMHPGTVETDMARSVGITFGVKPAEAVATMRKTIAEKTLSDSGKFISHDGTVLRF